MFPYFFRTLSVNKWEEEPGVDERFEGVWLQLQCGLFEQLAFLPRSGPQSTALVELQPHISISLSYVNVSHCVTIYH